MSDNEPLDLDQIAEWYNGLYQPEINEVYEPWAKYIAALVAEVHRLRHKINHYAEQDHLKYCGEDELFFPPYPDEKE